MASTPHPNALRDLARWLDQNTALGRRGQRNAIGRNLLEGLNIQNPDYDTVEASRRANSGELISLLANMSQPMPQRTVPGRTPVTPTSAVSPTLESIRDATRSAISINQAIQQSKPPPAQPALTIEDLEQGAPAPGGSGRGAIGLMGLLEKLQGSAGGRETQGALFPRNVGQAIAELGLGIAASKSPRFGQAAGEAGLAAMKTYRGLEDKDQLLKMKNFESILKVMEADREERALNADVNLKGAQAGSQRASAMKTIKEIPFIGKEDIVVDADPDTGDAILINKKTGQVDGITLDGKKPLKSKELSKFSQEQIVALNKQILSNPLMLMDLTSDKPKDAAKSLARVMGMSTTLAGGARGSALSLEDIAKKLAEGLDPSALLGGK